MHSPCCISFTRVSTLRSSRTSAGNVVITSPDIEYNGIEVVAIGGEVVVLNAIRPAAVDVCRRLYRKGSLVCRQLNMQGSFVSSTCVDG